MKLERALTLLLTATLCLAVAGCQPSVEPADLVLRNGRVVTVDDARPLAQALAIREGRILAVGSDAEIEPYVGSDTEVVDLDGALAIPGLIEGHGHFMGIGQARLNLDLTGAESWDAIVGQVAEAAGRTPPGEWIVGRGWHQDKWSVRPEPNVDGAPLHDSLSAASPDHPVMLTHASGHSSFVNAKAMELAGITGKTENPPGGEIVKDAKGRPIGLLRETAQGLTREVYERQRSQRTPEQIEAEARKMAGLAAQECVSKGLTSFQDAGSSYQVVDLFKALVEEGQMPLRLWVMLRESNDALRERMSQYRMIGFGDQRLTVRAIKRSIDGALGSHGAWLLEPYADMPSSTGLNTYPVDDLMDTAKLAIENDFQLCVHAIGDRANRETLDVFEKTFEAYPDKRGLRWRDEHAQHIHPDDIPRLAELGVIASMQAVHCTSDAPWVPTRLGAERAQRESYRWRELIDSGALVTNGTDAPVEDVDPIASYYAAVTRKLKDGSVFVSGQRMTREEALRSYTLDNAYAAFEEDLKGSLTPGKLGDVTVLDRDILTVPEEQIPEAQVLYTIVGGKIVFRR